MRLSQPDIDTEALSGHVTSLLEKALRDGFGASSVGAWEFHPSAQRFFLSAPLRRLLGATEAEVDDLAVLFIDRDRPRVRRFIANAVEYPGEYRSEFVLRKVEAGERRIGFACRTLEVPTGTIVVGVCFETEAQIVLAGESATPALESTEVVSASGTTVIASAVVQVNAPPEELEAREVQTPDAEPETRVAVAEAEPSPEVTSISTDGPEVVETQDAETQVAETGASESGPLVVVPAETPSVPSADQSDRWLQALKGSHLGMWDWDIEKNTLSVSGPILEMLGYSGEGPIGYLTLWSKLLHREDRRPTLVAVREHLQGQTERYRMEHRVLHADGRYRWVLSRGAAVRDEAGRPIRMIGVSTDITRRVETRRALEASEARLRAVVDGSFDGLITLQVIRSADGSIVDLALTEVNRRAMQMFRLEPAIIGARLLEQFPHAVGMGFFDRVCRSIQSQQRELSESASVLAPSDGRIYRQQLVPISEGVVVAFSDVTEIRRHETALRASEKLVREIAEAVPEFLYVLDVRTRTVTYRNRSIRAALGYTDRTSLGHQAPLLDEIAEPEDRQRLEEMDRRLRDLKDNGPVETEVRVRRPDGRLEWMSIRKSVFARDDRGEVTHLLASGSIISERKRSEERMREHVLALNRTQAELRVRQTELERLNERLMQLARKDGLTHIYNHRAFQERLTEEVARAERHRHPLSVLMGDVDDFKSFNDRFGHVAGDECLQYFAQVLQRCTRPSDFVARYGGEEFAVILPETHAAQGAIVAERVLETLAEETHERKITVSFGLAEYRVDADTPASLIEAADAALYAAKHSGKNRVALARESARLG